MSKGGGGGQSGKVDYPDYIETIHGQALDHAGTDTPTSSVTDLVNTALGSSPFSGETSYDPATPISEMEDALTSFAALVDGLDAETDWLSIIATAKGFVDDEFFDEDEVERELEAYSDQLRDQLDMVVLPRFRGGMRDINAVMSSAFAVGESIIEASNQRDVSKFLADLRLKMKTKKDEIIVQSAMKMLEYNLNTVELKKALMHYNAEVKRLTIVANKEETDTQLYIDVQDAKWDLEAMAYLGNMIASIAGASTVREGIDGPSTLRTAMGGALSGAAAGAMVGSVVPGIGTAVGAGIGGLLGVAGGLL